MKYQKIVFVLLLLVSACKSETVTPEKGFERLMEKTETAWKKGDYPSFRSLYTKTSDQAVIQQDFALDYSAFDAYEKELISVVENIDNNYLFVCSHYSVTEGNVDEMYFTAVLEQKGNDWKFNYDPEVIKKLNAMLVKDAYPEEMFETKNAITFDAPFFYLDDQAVYEGCVHTAVLNLWEKDQMYCQIWVSNGLDHDIQLNHFSLQVMDNQEGIIADDDIEIKESLEAGRSKTWVLPVQTLQNIEWSEIGVDYELKWS